MVDKIYMMYHSLQYNESYNIKAAWDDFYKSHPKITEAIEKSKRDNFDRAMKEALSKNPEADLSHYDLEELFDKFVSPYKNYEWVTNAKELFTEWFNINKDKYLSQKTVKTIEYNDTDIDLSDSNENRKLELYKQAKKNTKSQRDSMIIDLMYSVLTNSDTVDKMINPGNFDEQKRDARIVKLLNILSLDEINKLGGINKILHLSLKEANKMLNSYSEVVNPLTPDTWITYQQRNMSGANLVPVAATQNTSHALTQLTKKLGLKKEYRFIFNGKRLGSLNSIKSANNEYISKNVCSYLAAFVDNAKDPIAGDLNINSITANLAFLLLRIGNSPITTSLILKQPAMMKVMKLVNSGKYSMGQAIEQAISDYKSQKVPLSGKYTKTIDFNFTDNWLASNISAEKSTNGINSKHIEEVEFAENQMKVLAMIGKLNSAANALGDIVRSIRSDSQSGGAGGSIASVNSKITNLENVLMKAQNHSFPIEGLDFIVDMLYSQSEKKIINSSLPIQTATFQYGLAATSTWYNKLFPQVSYNYIDMENKIKKFTTYGNLDDTTINRIYSQYLVYLMTGISKNFTGNEESRNYFINDFPNEFAEFKKLNPFIVEAVPLLRRLKVLSSNKYNGSPTIVFNNVGKITDIQAEDYRSDFRNLLANENTRDLAVKLLKYSFYRGLGFSPSGFSNLIPSQLKMSDSSDYVPTLREIINFNPTDDDRIQFIYQYIRNNMDDRRFVPEVSMTGIFNTEPEDSFTVTVTNDSSQAMKKFIYPNDSNSDDIRYREFVCYTYNGKKNYYAYDSNNREYKKIKPLGSQQYQEYDYYDNGLLMESQIKEAKKKSFNFREDYRAATIAEESMKQFELSEEAYKNMPERESINLESISLNDLYSNDREARAARMEASFAKFDGQQEHKIPSEAENKQLSAMDKMFQDFDKLDVMSKDLADNERCK